MMCSICYNTYMKNYNFPNDIKLIRKCFNMSQEQFAKEVGLSRSNIARYEADQIKPSIESLEKIYNFSFSHGFNLNKSKSMIYEDDKGKNVILYHGAKQEIEGNPDTKHSIPPNDFGDGFYLGQTLEQANTWVCSIEKSSTYCFYFCDKQMKKMEFDVDFNWLYAILYYRGELLEYNLPDFLIKLINDVNETDYLIAPIADNQMYDTIEEFINGRITDVACLHALRANNLGYQYVLKSETACKELRAIDRFYLCEEERKNYLALKNVNALVGKNKTSLAITKYRREGKYFDEIFTQKR